MQIKWKTCNMLKLINDTIVRKSAKKAIIKGDNIINKWLNLK